VVAKALLDHAVGQFDADVEVFWVLEFRPLQPQFRPLPCWRQIAPRKIVDMRGGTEVRNLT
jgi:hypothetical protein